MQLKQYYYAKSADPGKLNVMQKLWEAIVKANLYRDLKVTKQAAFENFDGFLEHLHAYLNELSDTQIRDGLHIFGEAPTGFALEEFLVALTKLSNGSVPSLRQSIAELRGFDYDKLIENRGLLRVDGKTNGEVLDELNSLSLEIIKRFHTAEFKQETIPAILDEVLGGGNAKLQQCLSYVSSFLVPALEATTDELTHTLSASSGGYVPAGPSGAPTRGMADILPSGRNFYSVDPRAIPTAAAWKVGTSLGDALLKRYMQEEGKYPETVAMVVWATDCMRTNGDDVAEILYLMGVKPVWETSSGRVVSLEAIPFETLRRPRIDVAIRISGLFRDNFPNIVNLFDEAVALVAELKEGADKNYIAKHVETETAERIAKGVDAKKQGKKQAFGFLGKCRAATGRVSATLLTPVTGKPSRI